MKITITKVQGNNRVVLEEEIDMSKDAKKAIQLQRDLCKLANYAIVDLDFDPENIEKAKNAAANKKVENEETQLLPLASDKQKAYMDKLGLSYPENCTKIDAINIINDYKRANGIPVREVQ